MIHGAIQSRGGLDQYGLVPQGILGDLVSVSAPTVNDDASGTAGNGVFRKGSIWTVSSGTTYLVYLCFDATAGAAAWRQVGVLDASGTLVGPITLSEKTTTERLASTPAAGELVYDSTHAAANRPPLFVGNGAFAGGVLPGSQIWDAVLSSASPILDTDFHVVTVSSVETPTITITEPGQYYATMLISLLALGATFSAATFIDVCFVYNPGDANYVLGTHPIGIPAMTTTNMYWSQSLFSDILTVTGSTTFKIGTQLHATPSAGLMAVASQSKLRVFRVK